MNPLVSVILPVYNARQTIVRCLTSICAQTYKNIELCVINDCSLDNSLYCVVSYFNKKSYKNISLKIICHSENKGVAAARNTGLDVASGKYICFIDADDTLHCNALEMWVDEAEKGGFDIVGCEWNMCFGKNSRYMSQALFKNSQEALLNIMHGTMRWNLWLFIVKRSLYKDNAIRFIEGKNMGEDLMAMMKLFMHANKVTLIKSGLYNYNQINENSLTKKYSDAHWRQVRDNLKEIESYALMTPWADLVKENIPYLKLNLKLPLLMSEDMSKYNLWKWLWPETHTYIMKNKKQALRTRLLQWCGAKNLWWVIKWYYKIAYKFVYGIIYK